MSNVAKEPNMPAQLLELIAENQARQKLVKSTKKTKITPKQPYDLDTKKKN